jgi:hypothetical protein
MKKPHCGVFGENIFILFPELCEQCLVLPVWLERDYISLPGGVK